MDIFSFENMDLFSIIALSIYGFFAFIFLIGFLRGLRKGFYKSMVDVVIVFVSAALSVFVVKLLAQMMTDTNMVLNILNKVQGSVGEGDAYNLIESIKSFIASAPPEKDIVGGVMSLPVAIISPFLFMIVYPLLGLIIKIPKLIIESVALGPNGGDDYRGGNRLCGGLVGGVRLVISIAIFFIPLFGYLNLVDTTLNTVATTTVETVDVQSARASDDEVDEIKSNSFADVINGIARSCGDVRKSYIEPISNNFVIIKSKLLSMYSTFTESSKIKSAKLSPSYRNSISAYR